MQGILASFDLPREYRCAGVGQIVKMHAVETTQLVSNLVRDLSGEEKLVMFEFL